MCSLFVDTSLSLSTDYVFVQRIPFKALCTYLINAQCSHKKDTVCYITYHGARDSRVKTKVAHPAFPVKYSSSII
jgi:hypothetical protein